MDSPPSSDESMSARPTTPPPAPLASHLTDPAQTQSRPIPNASEMQMSSPPPVVDLTVFADMRTTSRGRGNELARDQATSLSSIAASIEFASAGGSAPKARKRSATPNAIQASSPTPSSGSRGRGTAARSTRGRPIGRTARDPAHEAELTAKRARYVPRSRGTPKTAMSLNPDYVAYSHLEQRPWGMEAFEKDEFDRLIIRKSELFCRVGDEDTGKLCHETKRFSGSEAVSGHVKSGKHRLPVGPRGFQGNIAAERADNAKFYKDVMARHRELGGPEPVYPDRGEQNLAAEEPLASNPAAGDYLPDAPGMMPTYFPGADSRATAPAPPSFESSAAANVPSQRGRPMTAQEHAAAVAALPTVAFDPIPSVPVVHGLKRKRTEAERELKHTKKELTIANRLRAEAEAEREQLRQENDELFNELKLIKPDLKRRKPKKKESGLATGTKEYPGEPDVRIKSEGEFEIKKEKNEGDAMQTISSTDMSVADPARTASVQDTHLEAASGALADTNSLLTKDRCVNVTKDNLHVGCGENREEQTQIIKRSPSSETPKTTEPRDHSPTQPQPQGANCPGAEKDVDNDFW